MKKILTFVIAICATILLVGCGSGKKPIATISNIEEGRTVVSFDVSIDDKGVLSEGSVKIKIFDEKGDSVGTVAMDEFYEEDITFSSLTMQKDYTVKIYGTYDKKQRLIKKFDVKTNDLGSVANPHIIKTVEDFELFRTDYSSDSYYILNNDLDFQDEEIDYFCGSRSKGFAGTFDGKGFTIKNFSVDASSTAYAGVFGVNKGTIKNLKFSDIEITCKKASTITCYVGLFGYNDEGANINDVDVENITINAGSTSIYVGGITGYNKGTIKNCEINNAAINVSKATSSLYIGGMVGANYLTSASKYGKIDNSSVSGMINVKNANNVNYGGTVGLTDTGTTISALSSNIDADIMATGYLYAGGICGVSKTNFDNLMVTGSITYRCATVSGETVTDSSSSSYVYVGGAVGSATAVNISNCYVDVDVEASVTMKDSGRAMFGGLFGNGYLYSTTAKKTVVGGTYNINTNTSDANSVLVGAIDGYNAAGSNQIAYNNLIFMVDSVQEINENVDYTIAQLQNDYDFDSSLWDIKEVENIIIFKRIFTVVVYE